MTGFKRRGGFLRGLVRLAALVVLVLGVIWLAQNVDLGRLGGRAGGELRGAVKEAAAAIPELDLDEIAAELKQTGRVVRRRAAGAAEKIAKAADEVEEATRDARTTAAIKARLALDPSLSAFAVSVDTTDGVVTLAGHVDSPGDVARAIQIAFEQDDVHEVISTLQLRQRRSAHGSSSVPRWNAAC